jgi:PAS domain S-box-containing protein
MNTEIKAAKPLRILHLEDSADDAELIRERLLASSHSTQIDWAGNKEEFTAFLQRGGYDVILADYRLPGFDAPAALSLARALSPGVPFIAVTGAVGDEKAVELLRQGATDYVLKDRLVELPRAIERALSEVGEQQARQHAEDALREGEAKYRSLFEAIPSPFYYKDCDGRYLGCNIAFERYLGLCKNEIVGRTVYDLSPKELADGYVAADKALLDHPGTHVYEDKVRWADGSLRDVMFHKATFTRADGGVGGIAGLMLDISERKAAEDQLRKLSLAVEQSPESVMITDIHVKIEYVNAAFVRNTGYSREEVLGQNPRVLHSGKTPRETYDSLWEALTHEQPWKGVFYNRRKDGSDYVEFASITPIRQPAGRVTHYLAVKEDITEKKLMGEELDRHRHHLEDLVASRTVQLAEAMERAEAANRAKSVFLANMSHELRTPLNAILGFSSMMRREPQLSKSQRENLDIINRSGAHLLTLINDVLEIAKIEAGRLQLEIVPFDLGSMVREVADMMQLRAQEKGLQLLLDQSSAVPRYIRGDAARLRQILVNLVSNAVKFTKQGGVTIRLGVKQNERQHLLIEVEDSGPGISPNDQKRLFKPFVQLTENSAQEGTGLGLTITRQFVQLMGGTISVDSTLGRGSLFQVELPLERVGTADILQPELKERGAVMGLAPGQPHYRILIAEDQHDNLLLLTQLMAVLGLEVKAAENGEQCVQAFQDWHPDLIWMDRRMPVMDGEEATRRIRQLPEGQTVKIVAVTASAFKEEQQELLDAGMNDFVHKPYRFDEIYGCLARQLGVTYLYQADTAEPPPPVALTPEMLTAFPAALRKELKDALTSLDSERIEAVILQVAKLDPELGRTLSRLTEYFEYPAILDALGEKK